ncbi:hypothetical protein DY000_02024027 [Brassica cretica]|uniref:Uncharacterized protein n=1 Tax=Brassica cretica TaxID=69181 RepID=A0ABQ7EL61_BRACR|nr:hypothetical protein DY000_02024027 [Brassica cretica]
MRCCAPDLKAHRGSLQAWTHTQSKLEEGSKVSHLMILLLNDLCYLRPLQAVHGMIQPKWREEEMEDSSIKSEREGGALHKAYHGAIMRSPSSLDLPYTRSQA